MTRSLCLVLALAAPSLAAAPIADPTRPPSAVAGEAAPGVPAGPRLESVLIAPDRRIAIISGQAVKVGEKYGDGQVVRITESEVVLRTGETTETLKLFPGVDKKPRARREKRSRP